MAQRLVVDGAGDPLQELDLDIAVSSSGVELISSARLPSA
jgi:hypothetical protein